jgi:hypothetical protein
MKVLFFGVDVISNRQLKSATRSRPLTGGLGEIPEPTVKVRMRENQRVVDACFLFGISKESFGASARTAFPPRDATSVLE